MQSAFTPTSYDALTGIVSVPDAVRVDLLQVGDIFKDSGGKEFVILKGLINTAGQKKFNIGTNHTVSTNPNATIIRKTSVKAVALKNDYLYIGGDFTSLNNGGVSAKGIATWDATYSAAPNVPVATVTAITSAYDDTLVQSGLPSGSHESWTNSVLDIDGNCTTDLFLGYHDQGGDIYLNNGNGTFIKSFYPANGTSFPSKKDNSDESGVNVCKPNVTADVWLDRHDCQWADFNGDGSKDTGLPRVY